MSRAAASLLRDRLPDVLQDQASNLEFDDVIDGEGTMVLDDWEIELHRGVVVYIPRGVEHNAIGWLTVLTLGVLRGVLYDVHEVD